jgi:FkbM family methyltransferase
MEMRLKALWYRTLQDLVIFTARPYVVRELPGWGRLFAAMVGDYERNWFWAAAPIKTIRGKRHGYLMRLDLSKWADRSAFFLGRWYDLSTQLLISDLLEAGNTVVDVGANRGMFALAASRLVGDAGKVICFEPNPNCFSVLDREIASNAISNIVVNKVGLGSREEELLLSVPGINSGEGTFGRSAYGEDAIYQVRAQVKRGDQILAEERPSLIKIDVEGFECNVLAGLSETINKHHPMILTEVVSAHLNRCGASVKKLKALMESLNYRGFLIRLHRAQGRYDWQLTDFDEENPLFDALWLHPDSMERYAKVLNEHTSRV